METVEAETYLTSVLKNRTIATETTDSKGANMQTRLLHAVLSGIIIAMVVGLSLIPATWQIIDQEPTFGSTTDGLAIIGIIASIAIIAVTLLSFKLMRRIMAADAHTS